MKHPGFKSVQSSIAKKQGISPERAGAILASSTRHASAAAKKANPHLKRVKGKMHDGGVVPESGLYEMKKGETVIPAPAVDHVPGKGRTMDGNNCCVLGTGGAASDHAHVAKKTPLDLKKRELADNKLTNPDEDTPMFRETARLRSAEKGHVKAI